MAESSFEIKKKSLEDLVSFFQKMTEQYPLSELYKKELAKQQDRLDQHNASIGKKVGWRW